MNDEILFYIQDNIANLPHKLNGKVLTFTSCLFLHRYIMSLDKPSGYKYTTMNIRDLNSDEKKITYDDYKLQIKYGTKND